MINKSDQENIKDLDLEVQEQLKQIVLARVRTIPSDERVSLGNDEYSSEELINHIENGDDVGKELVIMHWKYMQDIAKGALYDNE